MHVPAISSVLICRGVNTRSFMIQIWMGKTLENCSKFTKFAKVSPAIVLHYTVHVCTCKLLYIQYTGIYDFMYVHTSVHVRQKILTSCTWSLLGAS